ncbi:microfibrillar-associated protein 1-like [Pyrus ussuriensis x Pyrus communis]|uniref:Microfibrillar-associated protein 1-like n=1 Tax=Pyrus ussuriensis x Pyrus communis TaxID=2448454 RepID=A0A5N5F9Z4_9ROSA|nr:microfibrillar-associated protein 1-like [Pyrus ussuriensis x Pyrus communis]
MSVTVGVSDTVIAVRDKLRGKIGQRKLQDAADEDGDIRMFKAAESPTQGSHSYNVRKDDPRLRRWVESRTDNREDVRADRRRFRQAENVATTEEEAMTHQGWKRRKRMQMPRRKEDKGVRRRCRFKGSKKMKLHCFRQKTRKRRRNLTEEWALEEPRKKKLEERKRKTKQIVVEEIWKDKGLDQEVNIVAGIDSDDEVNEAEEYEAWKAREGGPGSDVEGGGGD